jgi:hypothetical protein
VIVLGTARLNFLGRRGVPRAEKEREHISSINCVGLSEPGEKTFLKLYIVSL